jgi:hypothetical protein
MKSKLSVLSVAGLFSLVATSAFAVPAISVPEPASLGLFGLGVVALILARRR